MVPAALAAVAAIKLVSVLPPPQYDHVPAVRPDYQFISPQAMQLICFAEADGYFIYSCARRDRLGTCHVYLPDTSAPGWNPLYAPGITPPGWLPDDDETLDQGAVAMLKRHEDGHCNGWSGDHPDAIIGGLV